MYSFSFLKTFLQYKSTPNPACFFIFFYSLFHHSIHNFYFYTINPSECYFCTRFFPHTSQVSAVFTCPHPQHVQVGADVSSVSFFACWFVVIVKFLDTISTCPSLLTVVLISDEQFVPASSLFFFIINLIPILPTPHLHILLALFYSNMNNFSIHNYEKCRNPSSIFLLLPAAIK